MNYELRDGDVSTHFDVDPYIPLNVRFDGEDYDVDRIGIYGPDGNLFEVATSLSTHEIKEVTLVHCERFERHAGSLRAPGAKSGRLFVELPEQINVGCFRVDVFCDGLNVSFNAGPADDYLCHGSVVFGMSRTSGHIVEVFILGIDSAVLESMIETIEYTQSQSGVVVKDGNFQQPEC